VPTNTQIRPAFGDKAFIATLLPLHSRRETTSRRALAQHVAAILRELKADDFHRVGNHSEAGQMTLETLLRNIGNHVPHHIQFIDEKRRSLGI
jgi:hypothetical protein